MEGLCLVHASLRVDRVHRVLWQYPAAGAGMSLPFQLDGDVFFGPGYTSISSHQENQDTIQVLTFPGGSRRTGSPGSTAAPTAPEPIRATSTPRTGSICSRPALPAGSRRSERRSAAACARPPIADPECRARATGPLREMRGAPNERPSVCARRR